MELKIKSVTGNIKAKKFSKLCSNQIS